MNRIVPYSLLLLALAACGGAAEQHRVVQIDPANCVTTIDESTSDCDGAHTLVLRCGAISGVGEATPSYQLCVAGPGAPGMTWCCEPALESRAHDAAVAN